jgi:hypothetical protein
MTVRPARKNLQQFSGLWKFEQGQGPREASDEDRSRTIKAFGLRSDISRGPSWQVVGDLDSAFLYAFD